jgi:hypothetical protein
MALTDLAIPSSTIAVDDDQNFTVFGLTFRDVEYIVEHEMGDLNAVIELFGQQMPSGDVDPDTFAEASNELLARLYTQYPALTARIIACASGDRSEAVVAHVERLPLPVQVDALLEVFRLTFSAPGGVKKFVAGVSAAAKALATSLPKFQKEISANKSNSIGTMN